MPRFSEGIIKYIPNAFQPRQNILELVLPRTRRVEYLPALTGLRFVLAAWVMLHHLAGPGMMLGTAFSALPAPLRALATGGYLAVQTFFLLSGFVLARNYAATRWNRSSLIRYWSARFARIYPTYLLSLAIVAYFIGRFLARPTVSATGKASALFDYAFLLQGWRNGGGTGWNTPAWSLSCELFFYLCLPAVLPAIWRARSRMLAAIVVVSFIAPIVLARLNVPYYWKPVHHFADFTMGIAAARVFELLELRPAKRRLAPRFYLPAMAIGALLIAWPHLLKGTSLDLNSALRPLNAVALIGLALGGGAVAKMLSAKVVDYLGQVSYSMYILHVPLLWWYGNGGVERFHLPPGIAALVFGGIVIAAAILSYELVEKPANRWIRNWTARRLAPAAELRAAA
jgi:peptidoglycan/LPS O-acetylase OafA/YrhL